MITIDQTGGNTSGSRTLNNRCPGRHSVPRKTYDQTSTQTWEQLGNRTRRKRGKTRIRADQKARRDNHLVIADPVCKTSIPGSNPGGASKFF
jgi:hypothetical protein